MKVDNRAKLIIDIENNYLFDDKELVVLLTEEKDLKILNKYANNNYSIGGNVKSDDETNYKIIRNYNILKEKSGKKLKKYRSAILSLFSKLNLNSLNRERRLLVLSFDDMVNM